jgi:peptidoglycan/xylan/chitin deacetylase (PgdA/CDA1 family)
MKRRDFLIGSAAATFTACAPNITAGPKPRLAVTMDDFNLNFSQVLPPLERNERILSALAKHNHKAAGFVTGRFVNNEMGDKVVQTWSEAGHLLGNHTYTHMNSTEEDVRVIEADILKNDELMSNYAGYEKIFRFPFLAEGGDLKKIEHYRKFLRQNSFRTAPVTIDTIDWYTATRLETYLKADPSADLSGFRDYYVDMVITLANHFQSLAERLGYNDLPHTMLMHHTLLNGLFLDDVLSALKADGWDFVDAREAFKHPIYELKPETPTQGRSLLSVLAIEKGLGDTHFPDIYRGFGQKTMDALGL